MMINRNRRWSDEQKTFGIVTYTHDKMYRNTSFILDSGRVAPFFSRRKKTTTQMRRKND